MKTMITYDDYDHIFVSISGGKDSQAALKNVYDDAIKVGKSADITAVHIDNGNEWPQAIKHCKAICGELNVTLEIGKPFRNIFDDIRKYGRFPSPQCRFCTAANRDAAEKIIRKAKGNVLIVTGERREESFQRAKYNKFEEEKRLCCKSRTVHRYRPIIDWSEQRVIDSCNSMRCGLCEVYALGNTRLSCVICPISSEADMRNGAKHNQYNADMMLALEDETGQTIRTGKSLRQILR